MIASKVVHYLSGDVLQSMPLLLLLEFQVVQRVKLIHCFFQLFWLWSSVCFAYTYLCFSFL